MQQNDIVTNDLQTCNLSLEEIENPFIVFENLFRHNDLMGLCQLNTGLIRSAITGDGFDKLPANDQSMVVGFLSEVCRMIEAIHLLCLRGGNKGDIEEVQCRVDKTAVSSNEAEAKERKETDKPTHLNEEEINNPSIVLKEFVEDFSLLSVREFFSTMVDTCVTSEAVCFAEASAREDLLYVSKHIVKVLEAAYLIVKKESQKEGKLIIHDFHIPAGEKPNHA